MRLRNSKAGAEMSRFFCCLGREKKIQMKNMRILTEEQKIFAEQNHMLVERFLWKNHLERAEFYDVVIFGYLKAVQEFLEKPELSKYPFSSIAWRKMRYSMIKEYIYRNCPKRNAPMGTYREDYDCVFAEHCNITMRGVSARLIRMRRRFRALALI